MHDLWPGWRLSRSGLYARPDGVMSQTPPPPYPAAPFRVIVCGGRDFTSQGRVYAALEKLHWRMPITLLLHGAAPGAESLADGWAASMGVERLTFPADQLRGPRAGQERNAQMAVHGADGVVAFPGGRDTADMCQRAEAAGIRVWWPYG